VAITWTKGAGGAASTKGISAAVGNTLPYILRGVQEDPFRVWLDAR
jgi:hypothetical protein